MTGRPHFAADLSHLPSHAFGPRSLTWWGVMGFITIELIGFALAIAAYFYLMSQERAWPPATRPPDLLWGAVQTIGLLLSYLPNRWTRQAAEHEDLPAARRMIALMTVVGVLLLVVRGFEFAALHIGWDSNAYGSILWALLLLHTLHLATDFGDTAVLAALLWTRHGGNPRRLVDASENAVYWNFVILAWLPIYGLLYLLPRWM